MARHWMRATTRDDVAALKQAACAAIDAASATLFDISARDACRVRAVVRGVQGAGLALRRLRAAGFAVEEGLGSLRPPSAPARRQARPAHRLPVRVRRAAGLRPELRPQCRGGSRCRRGDRAGQGDRGDRRHSHRARHTGRGGRRRQEHHAPRRLLRGHRRDDAGLSRLRQHRPFALARRHAGAGRLFRQGRARRGAAGARHQRARRAAAGLNGIGALRQQLPSDVRVHTIITKGGTLPQVVPDHTTAVLTVRANNTATPLNAVIPRIDACLQGGAQMTGARLERTWRDKPGRELLSNFAMARELRPQSARRSGARRGRATSFRAPGRGDTGNVSWFVPTIQPQMAMTARTCRPTATNSTPPRSGRRPMPDPRFGQGDGHDGDRSALPIRPAARGQEGVRGRKAPGIGRRAHSPASSRGSASC